MRSKPLNHSLMPGLNSEKQLMRWMWLTSGIIPNAGGAALEALSKYLISCTSLKPDRTVTEFLGCLPS